MNTDDHNPTNPDPGGELLPPEKDDLLIYELDERLEFGIVTLDVFGAPMAGPPPPPVNTYACSPTINIYKCT
jgi:hypothetical protein